MRSSGTGPRTEAGADRRTVGGRRTRVSVRRRAYRALKAQASLEGRTIGDAVNEAIRAYVGRPGRREKTGGLRSLQPQEFPPGDERLSEEIDTVVYGN